MDTTLIKEICIRYKIKNYTINPDGSIDVDDNVNLSFMGLSELPLKFNKVFGSFDCVNNKLTTLKGSPKHVGGWFDCSNNRLTTLKHCPDYIHNFFYCKYNKLEYLDYLPHHYGSSIVCRGNPLKELPMYLIEDIKCDDKDMLIKKSRRSHRVKNIIDRI